MGRAIADPRGVRVPFVDVRPAVRAIWLVLAALAVVGAVTGGRLLISDRGESQIFAGEVTLSGLTAQLRDAGWVGMDHHQINAQAGFQMPAQMMPGAPEGDNMRLGVPLTLVNTDGKARAFSLAEEFFLVGGRTMSPLEMHSDTLGTLTRLSPGSAVNGVIYFDTVVPGAADPPLYLLWKRDGGEVRLAIPRISNSSNHDNHDS